MVHGGKSERDDEVGENVRLTKCGGTNELVAKRSTARCTKWLKYNKKHGKMHENSGKHVARKRQEQSTEGRPLEHGRKAWPGRGRRFRQSTKRLGPSLQFATCCLLPSVTAWEYIPLQRQFEGTIYNTKTVKKRRCKPKGVDD